MTFDTSTLYLFATMVAGMLGAMLIFFGDPESKGEAEDAKACMRMALDMQHRLAELTGLDPERTSSNISDSYYAKRQPSWLLRRAGRQGVRQQIRSNSEQKTPREYK